MLSHKIHNEFPDWVYWYKLNKPRSINLITIKSLSTYLYNFKNYNILFDLGDLQRLIYINNLNIEPTCHEVDFKMQKGYFIQCLTTHNIPLDFNFRRLCGLYLISELFVYTNWLDNTLKLSQSNCVGLGKVYFQLNSKKTYFLVEQWLDYPYNNIFNSINPLYYPNRCSWQLSSLYRNKLLSYDFLTDINSAVSGNCKKKSVEPFYRDNYYYLNVYKVLFARSYGEIDLLSDKIYKKSIFTFMYCILKLNWFYIDYTRLVLYLRRATFNSTLMLLVNSPSPRNTLSIQNYYCSYEEFFL